MSKLNTLSTNLPTTFPILFNSLYNPTIQQRQQLTILGQLLLRHTHLKNRKIIFLYHGQVNLHQREGG